MQRQHDLAGGSAPHLDFRSLNGMNDGYGAMGRRLARPEAIGPVQMMKAHAPALNAGAAQPNARKGQDVVMAAAASSSSDDRPPPPPPGAAKVRRIDPTAPVELLFPAGTPYAEALAAQQKAPLAADAAAAALAPYVGPRREGRERSPPRGDRRPLAKRNQSREERAAAGGAKESYGQMRQKALGERSKTVPAEVFIGEAPKRSQPVRPPNQSALNRRAAPRADAQKRGASHAAEDRRTKPRGGAANAERAERRDKKAANERLYEESQGNVKAKRPAKKAKTQKSVSQSTFFRPKSELAQRTSTACAGDRPREARTWAPIPPLVRESDAWGSSLERALRWVAKVVHRYQRRRHARWISPSQLVKMTP